jgi:hypothetical protein
MVFICARNAGVTGVAGVQELQNRLTAQSLKQNSGTRTSGSG